jgi:chorismate mutase
MDEDLIVAILILTPNALAMFPAKILKILAVFK